MRQSQHCRPIDTSTTWRPPLAASRATLVREFRRLAKAAPLEVLAEIRLGLARHPLVASAQPLADVACEAGYTSQAAFSRAFNGASMLA